LLTPGMAGVDVNRPAHLFLLTYHPPDALPTPAALVPLSVAGGAAYLRTMQGLYEERSDAGSVSLFMGAKDASYPDPLYVAIAEGYAITARRLEGLRWLAAHQRDRTTPFAARLDAPIRMTVDAPSLGLLLELMAMLESPPQPQTAAPADRVAVNHLRELGLFCASFSTFDLGLDANALHFELSVQAHAASNTALARTVASLPPLTPQAGRPAPAGRLGAAISVAPGLLAALPSNTVAWCEYLANVTHVLGLHIAPGCQGWLATLAPHLTGEHFAALLPRPNGTGMCVLQVFDVRDQRQAGAVLASLCTSPPTGARLRGAVPLPVRTSGGVTIHGFQLAESTATPASTNQVHGAGVEQALRRLLNMNCLELAVCSNRLWISQGAPRTLDQWLSRSEAPAGDAYFSVADRYLPSIPTDATLLGGAELMPLEALRRVVTLLPGVSEKQLATLPRPGDGVGWRLSRRGSTLIWQACLPTNELFAWRRLRELDPVVMQELLTLVAMQKFQGTIDDSRRQNPLREPIRRLRQAPTEQ
ncbi:MAG: hypothetical protein PHR35_16705, partial [Kiritimatiellae bacterium]|nr:hypothetical protein [Kiritimatiellia bacterium]